MGHITDQYGPYYLMNNEQRIMNNYLLSAWGAEGAT